MIQTKAQLRDSLKLARLELDAAEHNQKSSAIKRNLEQVIDWSTAGNVHCFEPIADLGEVDISGFTDKIQMFTSRNMGREWKIVSVKGDSPVPQKFDVIIVPMLGFDPKSLHRIGYGGGYYDKFLAAQPQAQKIGVCFEAGKIENIPTEPHDMQLDKIVTENQIYQR